MCRYGFNRYKPHFVCFNCRKVFKQTNPTDILKKVGKLERYNRLLKKDIQELKPIEELLYKTTEQDHFNRPIKCPQCSQLMANLGFDFKAPRQTAIKQWQIIKGMYTSGHSFYSCGCNGPGFVPKDNIEYKNYLIEKLNGYNECLKKTQNTFDSISKNEQTKYWGERINLIENEMLKMNFSTS